MNLLESLKRFTTVVADTGDFEAIAEYQPQDATTNPSLLFQAAQKPAYEHLVDDALHFAIHCPGDRAARTEAFMDKLLVNFGTEILKIIPGRVSNEVDARLSFDTEASLAKARKLIAMYEKAGISRERILIKPFVGRIYDWYRKERGEDIPADEDPGVASVTRIYNYFKKFGYKTQIMGASFRKVDQIVRLAGGDLLTISPDLLKGMEHTEGEVTRRLSVQSARVSDVTKIHLDEK